MTIPENVATIGSYAFLDCSNLTEITIPETVTSIGSMAFSSCIKAVIYVKADSEAHKYSEENKIVYMLDGEATNINTEYEVPIQAEYDISSNGDGSIKAVWTRSDRTLKISGTGDMKDYSTLPSIEWYKYRHIIKNIIIENGVTAIGSLAFYDCNSLIKIIIPETVTIIKSCAFFSCSSLTEIAIPGTLTGIGESAFYGCSALAEITIPKTVASIEEGAFGKCSSLEKINVDENNKNYISIDNVLYSKDMKKLILYPEK